MRLVHTTLAALAFALGGGCTTTPMTPRDYAALQFAAANVQAVGDRLQQQAFFQQQQLNAASQTYQLYHINQSLRGINYSLLTR